LLPTDVLSMPERECAGSKEAKRVLPFSDSFRAKAQAKVLLPTPPFPPNI
jgi:hypothetical protein